MGFTSRLLGAAPNSRWLLVAVCVAVLFAAQACDTDSGSSPTTPANLTGQNPNTAATFSGTISIAGGGTAPADFATDVVVAVDIRAADGNPVANGTPVWFTTTLGTVRTAGMAPATAGSSVQAIAFGGIATVALRSAVAGTATLIVTVGDKSQTLNIRFTDVQVPAFVSLAIRAGAGDLETLQSTAPLSATLVATVRDIAGLPIAAREVRFRKTSDSTAGTGLGAAAFVGPRRSRTNASGEAVSVVDIKGVGSVSLLADLFDSVRNDIVGESNQVVVTTTAVTGSFAVTLQFGGDEGGTFLSMTEPGSAGLTATVRDQTTGDLLVGRKVRFVISSDTATVLSATLASTGSSLTNDVGEASNAVTTNEAATTVTLVAQLLSSAGAVEAESNQITVVVETAVVE